jgi:hypothetical protein
MIWLSLVLACSGPTTTESASDSGTGLGTDEPPEVPYVGLGPNSPEDVLDPIDWGCSADDWTYEFYTVGLSGGVDLRFAETDPQEPSPVDEVHPLLPAQSDPDGWWTHFTLTLLIEENEPAVLGATTNATCEGEDLEAREVSWQLIVYEADGTSRADCAVWGAHPLWFEDTDCYIW